MKTKSARRKLVLLRRDNDITIHRDTEKRSTEIRRKRNTVTRQKLTHLGGQVPKKRNTAIVLFCIFVFSFFGISVSPYLDIPPSPFGITFSRYYGISPARAADSLYFIHTDHLGSTVAITDEDGEIVSQNRYFPYGEDRSTINNQQLTIPSQDISITERAYTSQINDAVTGLYYYNARYYDPALGVFVSADPAGDTLNRYSYVHGNPLVYIDPTGNQIFVAGVGIILTIGGCLMAAGTGKALGASVADLFVPHEDEFGPIESITSEGFREGVDLYNVGAGLFAVGTLADPWALWADVRTGSWQAGFAEARASKNAAILKPYIEQGLEMIKEGRYDEAIAHFGRADVAQSVGVSVASGKSAIITGDLKPEHVGPAFDIMSRESLFLDRGAEYPPYLLLSRYHLFEGARNPSVERVAHNAALLRAEEWTHALQYYGGSLTGLSYGEYDVAAWFSNQRVPLTSEWLSMYGRSEIVP